MQSTPNDKKKLELVKLTDCMGKICTHMKNTVQNAQAIDTPLEKEMKVRI